MLGVFMSLDFFLFYVFWEIVLMPMYFIIGIWGGEREALRCHQVLPVHAVGSVLMLLGILVLYFQYHAQFGATRSISPS